jgi:hypothetical protein
VKGFLQVNGISLRITGLVAVSWVDNKESLILAGRRQEYLG